MNLFHTRYFYFPVALIFWIGWSVSSAESLSACENGLPVRTITFEGLEHTQNQVVQRELLNQVSRPFSEDRWQNELHRLLSLDLFSEVQLQCEKKNDSLSLTYRFTELFSWIPAPAGKKTDQDGWMLGLALANLNVAGKDIRAEVQYRASLDPWMDAQEYALYTSSPWLLNYPVGWNLEFLRTDSWDNLRNFQERSWYAHGDVEARVKGHFALLLSGSYRYLETIGKIPDAGAGVLWDNRDSRMDSRNGVYEEFRVTQYGGFLGGSDDYQEYLWDSRIYKDWGRFISHLGWLARYRPGTQGFYDRLQEGGANTLRGFDPDSAVHGKHEILWNAEERFVLLERRPVSVFGANLFWGLQLVGGVDGSFLWDEDMPGWENYRSAVYAGVHLVIPALDRLRIEVGYSPDGDGPKIAISLFEKAVSQRWRSR